MEKNLENPNIFYSHKLNLRKSHSLGFKAQTMKTLLLFTIIRQRLRLPSENIETIQFSDKVQILYHFNFS